MTYVRLHCAGLHTDLEEFLLVHFKTRLLQAYLRCKRVCLEACARPGSLLEVSGLLSAASHAEYLPFLLLIVNKKEKGRSALTASIQPPTFTANLLLA